LRMQRTNRVCPVSKRVLQLNPSRSIFFKSSSGWLYSSKAKRSSAGAIRAATSCALTVELNCCIWQLNATSPQDDFVIAFNYIYLGYEVEIWEKCKLKSWPGQSIPEISRNHLR
jgi:hypothetical protein